MAAANNALVAIRDMVSGNRLQLTTALGAALDVDRLANVALREIAQTPALLACTPLSLFQSIHRAATMGLLIGEGLGHAYLVPFGNQAQLIPGYRGLVYLAVKSGAARSITAHVVHEGDELDLVHGRPREGTLRPRFQEQGKPIGAIAFAELDDERQIALFMSLEQIEKVRAASRAKNGDLWTKWWDEAACKTVTRRLIKRLPVSIANDNSTRLATAMADDGEFAELKDIEVDVKEAEPPKTRTEATRERLTGKAAATAAPAIDGTAEKPPAERPEPKPRSSKKVGNMTVNDITTDADPSPPPASPADHPADAAHRAAMLEEIIAKARRSGDPRSADNLVTQFVQQFCRDAGVQKITALDNDALEQLRDLVRDLDAPPAETLFQ